MKFFEIPSLTNWVSDGTRGFITEDSDALFLPGELLEDADLGLFDFRAGNFSY